MEKVATHGNPPSFGELTNSTGECPHNPTEFNNQRPTRVYCGSTALRPPAIPLAAERAELPGSLRVLDNRTIHFQPGKRRYCHANLQQVAIIDARVVRERGAHGELAVIRTAHGRP